jgi:hypothetical protein
MLPMEQATSARPANSPGRSGTAPPTLLGSPATESAYSVPYAFFERLPTGPTARLGQEGHLLFGAAEPAIAISRVACRCAAPPEGLTQRPIAGSGVGALLYEDPHPYLSCGTGPATSKVPTRSSLCSCSIASRSLRLLVRFSVGVAVEVGLAAGSDGYPVLVPGMPAPGKPSRSHRSGAIEDRHIGSRHDAATPRFERRHTVTSMSVSRLTRAA